MLAEEKCKSVADRGLLPEFMLSGRREHGSDIFLCTYIVARIRTLRVHVAHFQASPLETIIVSLPKVRVTLVYIEQWPQNLG